MSLRSHEPAAFTDRFRASQLQVLFAVGLALLIGEVDAGMLGFGKKYDVELFPFVEGRVTQNGAPLKNATVIREATYDGAEVQETVTDQDGYFSFPEWVVSSRTPGKPLMEARLRQVIIVSHETKAFVLWYYVTGRIDGEKVIAEKLRTLHCELNDDEVDHHFQKAENPNFTHNVSSICRW